MKRARVLLVSLCSVVVAALCWTILVKAHEPGVVLSGFGVSTVDGVLSAGEWDNAGRIDFLV